MYALNARRFDRKSRFSTPRSLGTRYFQMLSSSHSLPLIRSHIVRPLCGRTLPAAPRPPLRWRAEWCGLVIDDAAPGNPLRQVLSRNGSHMSTQVASIRFRCLSSAVCGKTRPESHSSASYPNHSDSLVSRLHTTVRNLSCFHPVNLVPPPSASAPVCGGLVPPQR